MDKFDGGTIAKYFVCNVVSSTHFQIERGLSTSYFSVGSVRRRIKISHVFRVLSGIPTTQKAVYCIYRLVQMTPLRFVLQRPPQLHNSFLFRVCISNAAGCFSSRKMRTVVLDNEHPRVSFDVVVPCFNILPGRQGRSKANIPHS